MGKVFCNNGQKSIQIQCKAGKGMFPKQCPVLANLLKLCEVEGTYVPTHVLEGYCHKLGYIRNHNINPTEYPFYGDKLLSNTNHWTKTELDMFIIHVEYVQIKEYTGTI